MEPQEHEPKRDPAAGTDGSHFYINVSENGRQIIIDCKLDDGRRFTKRWGCGYFRTILKNADEKQEIQKEAARIVKERRASAGSGT